MPNVPALHVGCFDHPRYIHALAGCPSHTRCFHTTAILADRACPLCRQIWPHTVCFSGRPQAVSGVPCMGLLLLESGEKQTSPPAIMLTCHQVDFGQSLSRHWGASVRPSAPLLVCGPFGNHRRNRTSGFPIGKPAPRLGFSLPNPVHIRLAHYSAAALAWFHPRASQYPRGAHPHGSALGACQASTLGPPRS